MAKFEASKETIRDLCAVGEITQAEAARKYGVDAGHISAIIHNKKRAIL